MTIYYALVARGSTILVDFTEHNGNFQQITTNILQNVDVSTDSMCSYTSNRYSFHVVINNGLIFLCMSDESTRTSIAYGYINEIKKIFMGGTLKERAYHCNAYELRYDFESVLKQQMARYNKGGVDIEGNSQIYNLQKDVDGLKTVMTENIDKLLSRGERLDILVGKTEDLSKSSESFARSAKKVKNKMWWQNKKMCLILSCILFIILAILTLVILYEVGVFSGSSSSSTSPTTTIKPTPVTTKKPTPVTTKKPTSISSTISKYTTSQSTTLKHTTSKLTTLESTTQSKNSTHFT